VFILVALFCGSGEKAQKGLLGGLERLCGGLYPEKLMAKVPVLLMAVYEADLVEEDVFMAWGEKISKRYVDKPTGKKIRGKAAPFLKWLKEAEDEEESD
jgi:translation initiation factor 5